MKKQYFLMAMAATMFAACSQTEVIDEVVDNSTPKAIGFTTYTEGQTRAENSTGAYAGDLENHHNTFNVWAYKNVTDTKVFNSDIVNHDGTKWDYTDTRYWDKAATSYEFYAAAPSGFDWKLNPNGTDQNDDYFTLENYELKGDNLNTTAFTNTPTESFKALTNDKDLMIADKKKVETVNFYKDVQLQFIHILSRLNVTIKKEGIADKVNLFSLEVFNLKNTGDFEEVEIVDNTKGSIRWETEKTASISYRYVGNEEVETTAKYAIQALVLPQEVEFESVKLDGDDITLNSKPFIKIVYTITSGTNVETFAAYYNLANAFGSSAEKISFYEGWQNILNITIKPTAINFDATTAEWVFKYNKDLTIE